MSDTPKTLDAAALDSIEDYGKEALDEEQFHNLLAMARRSIEAEALLMIWSTRWKRTMQAEKLDVVNRQTETFLGWQGETDHD